jgi:outer membrane biosynthesis protein TonB
MNSTITRLALAAPATAAILGWSLTAAEAAPYEPSDHIEVQHAEKPWPDDFAVEDPDDIDEPEDPPADEPADEPAEEPADEADEELDEKSDEDPSDEDSDDNGQPAPVQKSDDEDQGSSGQPDAADTDADVVETASSTDLAPSVRPAGVRVPLLMVIGAGALVTGVAGWAGYRRSQLLAH